MLLLLLLSRFSHVRLCDPIGGSPPGSSVPGILQARTLEWVAISFSNAGKWKVKVKPISRARPSATPWTAAYQAPPSMGFSRQEYWSGVPLPSPSLIIRQMQIKNKIRFNFKLIRMAVKKKKWRKITVSEHMKKLQSLNTVSGDVKLRRLCGKQYGISIKK